MKILVISSEVWCDATNGGNVLSNVFSCTGFEFAQIYCTPGTPQNRLCRRYYQMTDAMVIKSFFTRKPIGQTFMLNASQNNLAQEKVCHPEQQKKNFYSFFHRCRWNIFYLAKDIAWTCCNWKNEGLRNFILEFDPDVVFAPCYGSPFMLHLTRYAAKLTGKNFISYISDDSYTLKQFRLSPLYWLRRFWIRHELRKTFPYYALVYTMTEIQKAQCAKDFNANMKILLKSVPFGEIPDKTSVGEPIRLIYAGGIYLNRWKTLAIVADAIREINRNGIRMVLDIYTGNEISRKMNEKLNDGVHSTIHPTVSQDELREIYRKSDVALHVESFDLTNRLAVRMSFSTKIVDCLASGCAVLAIADAKQGGVVYLKDEDAALCVSRPRDILSTLQQLVASPAMITEYAAKAKACCQRNHDREKNTRMIQQDFARL